MDNISKILLSSSKIIIDNFALDAFSKKDLSQLKLNEFLQASVLKVFSNRNATLSIQGKTVSVKTSIPLKEGEEIFVKAEKSGDQYVLKIVDKGGQGDTFGQRFLKNLDRTGPFKNIEKLINEFGSKKVDSEVQGNLDTEKLSRTIKFVSNQLEKISAKSPQIKAEYHTALEKVVLNKNIAPELKLAALLTKREDVFGPKSSMPKNIQSFLSKVVDTIVEKESSLISKPDIVYDQKISTNASKSVPNRTEKHNLVKLSNFTDKYVSKLSGQDKILLESFTDKNQLKFEHKLLGILVNNDKFFNSAKLSGLDIKDTLLSLLKNLDEDIDIPKNLFTKLSNQISTNSTTILTTKSTIDQPFTKSGKTNTTQQKSDVLNSRIKDIENLVKDISLKSGTKETNILKNIIKSSGLKWENSILKAFSKGLLSSKANAEDFILKDLKGLALSMVASGDSGDEEIGTLVRNFVDTLDQMQIINSYSSEESGRYLLPLPAMVDDILTFGQLLIDLGSGKKDGKDSKDRLIRVAFILELTQLGDLRADFSILKKAISGVFGVGTPELSSFIKSGLPELTDKLNDLGYSVHHIDCQVIDSEILSNTSLSDQLITEDRDGILNLVI